MIKIEKVKTMGWEPAIRGMRNPMNSWDKSDSVFVDYIDYYDCKIHYHYIDGRIGHSNTYENWGSPDFNIGDADLSLMKRLVAGGSEHAKFRRMVVVYADITAPLYWWKEFDTYKVGTVANSCSTMHKIHDKKFTIDDFSCEHIMSLDKICKKYNVKPDDIVVFEIDEDLNVSVEIKDNLPVLLINNADLLSPHGCLRLTILMLNKLRDIYNKDRTNKETWNQMIQLLPSSYNQKRTVMMNYEVLANIYSQRRNHKLKEWRDFCKWIESLPYAKELITREKEVSDNVSEQLTGSNGENEHDR